MQKEDTPCDVAGCSWRGVGVCSGEWAFIHSDGSLGDTYRAIPGAGRVADAEVCDGCAAMQGD